MTTLPENVSTCPSENAGERLLIADTYEDANTIFQEDLAGESPNAICQEDGSYYVQLDKIGMLSVQDSKSLDPKAAKVYEIFRKKAALQLFEGYLEEHRQDLTEALAAKQHLIDTDELSTNPIATLLYDIGFAAIGFGVVTGIFEDVLTLMTTSTGFLNNLAFKYERQLQIDRLMVEGNLCGSRGSNFASRGRLIASALPTAIMAGAVALSAYMMGEWMAGGAKKEEMPGMILSDEAVKKGLSKLTDSVSELPKVVSVSRSP